MEQNIDLFYELCNKYGVEVSDKTDKITVKDDNGNIVELTKNTSKETLKKLFELD